jgi:hypothetical protein
VPAKIPNKLPDATSQTAQPGSVPQTDSHGQPCSKIKDEQLTRAPVKKPATHGKTPQRGVERSEKDQRLQDLSFRELVARANTGDDAAIKRLRTVLDSNPDIWRAAGDLAGKAEQLMINLLAGNSELARESIRRKLNDMRTELAGTAPGPLERLAVERVVMCWLQLQHLDIVMAVPALELKAGSHYGRLQDQASRRLNAAIKALTTLRQLAGARPATAPEPPQDGVRLFSRFGFGILPTGSARPTGSV